MTGLELAIRIVASVLAGEAGHEPEAGVNAVAETIAVRMQDRKQDAITVVTARSQYCAWVSVRHSKAVAAEWERREPAKWAKLRVKAEQVINGTFAVSEHRWNHFYRPKRGRKTPAWLQDFVESKRIGKHIFGRIP